MRCSERVRRPYTYRREQVIPPSSQKMMTVVVWCRGSMEEEDRKSLTREEEENCTPYARTPRTDQAPPAANVMPGIQYQLLSIFALLPPSPPVCQDQAHNDHGPHRTHLRYHPDARQKLRSPSLLRIQNRSKIFALPISSLYYLQNCWVTPGSSLMILIWRYVPDEAYCPTSSCSCKIT